MAKIVSFEAENVKRVKAVTFEPTANGLTIIGGGNGQGKTSVLDAIAWALGGDRFKPSNAKHEGSVTDPKLRIELDNGIIVERKGKNSALKVIDPSGAKGGQALLDSFVEPLALNLPKFMNQSNADKARTLLNIIGVGEQLFELEEEEQALYNQRTAIGQMEKQKRGAASEMSFYPDAPAEPVSASELIRQQ
ncbi:MAG: AAA family ATPase, partial [Bacteroidaceae bacterium]|nr:AAA family ATPase [Bacteroidaceae bacterium]